MGTINEIKMIPVTPFPVFSDFSFRFFCDGSDQLFRDGFIDFVPCLAVSAGVERGWRLAEKTTEFSNPLNGGITGAGGTGKKHLGQKSPECDGGRIDVFFFFGEVTLGIVEGLPDIFFSENVGEGKPVSELQRTNDGLNWTCRNPRFGVRRHEDHPWQGLAAYRGRPQVRVLYAKDGKKARPIFQGGPKTSRVHRDIT